MELQPLNTFQTNALGLSVAKVQIHCFLSDYRKARPYSTFDPKSQCRKLVLAWRRLPKKHSKVDGKMFLRAYVGGAHKEQGRSKNSVSTKILNWSSNLAPRNISRGHMKL